MRSSLLLAALAALFILPATALAFRYSTGNTLAQTIPASTLRMGDRGAPVAELQELLVSRGFDPGPVDGIFGPLTLQGVLAAQRYYGLEQDGLAGRLTMGALRNQAPVDGVVTTEAPESPLSETTAPPAAASSSPSVAAAPRSQSPQSGAALAVVEKGTLMLYEARSAAASAAAASAKPTASSNPAAGSIPAAGSSLAGDSSLALTFNHLPDPDTMEAILATLADHAMQATFFVTGEEAESNPSLLRLIAEAGHEVGNLGYTNIDMRRLSPMTARAHLRRTQRAVREATGESPTAFRPPLGLFDRELAEIVEEEGLGMALWSNVTIFPDTGLDPALLAQRLAERLFPEMVLMLPLDEPGAADTVSHLLEQMDQAGYAGRRLGDMLSNPRTASTTN